MTLDESKAERIVGLVFTCIGILLFLVVIPWQIKDVGADFPTPRTFPNFIALATAGLGVVLFLTGRKKKGKPDLKHYSLSKKEARLVGITVGLMLLYIFSLYYIPYIPATIVILGLMVWFYGQKSWMKIVGTAVCVPVVIYFSFNYLLQLRLP